MSDDEQSTEYNDYLSRFEEEFGNDHDFGAFVKYKGLLIQKLERKEFDALFRDYNEITQSYFASLKRGDTINDLVVRKMREIATKLVMNSPV